MSGESPKQLFYGRLFFRINAHDCTLKMPVLCVDGSGSTDLIPAVRILIK